MNHFLRRALVFLLVAALVYTALMALMAHVRINGRPLVFRTGDYYALPGGSSWALFKEYDPGERQDAVIIGSSHAYRGYDPQVFQAHGHRVFNLGTSAQSPLNSFQLIRHFLDSSNCPLLIYDLYDGVMLNDGFESTVDLTQNQSSWAVALGLAWAQRDLRGLNMLSLRLLSRRDSSYYDYGEYQGRGFTLWTDSIKTPAGRASLAEVEFPERQRHFLEASLRLCRERGIKVVATNHYARSNMLGTRHRMFKHYADSILAATGTPYLDLSTVEGIDDRNWFADGTHLNGTGARIFTAQLVDTLEALGHLRRR